MAEASFSLEFSLRVTCVRCGIERDLPENERPMPATDKGEALTVFADTPCGCGAKRVRVEALIASCGEDGS